MPFKFPSSNSSSSSSSSSLPTIIYTVTFRTLQFIFALTVLGLYGTDISSARNRNAPQDSRWVYAEVVGAFSAVTSLVYLIPFVWGKSHLGFGWDAILFILWTAVFGTFAKLYLHVADTIRDSGVQRRKNAVWIDLINMLLWLVTAIVGGFLFMKRRGGRSTFTGRAAV